VVNASLQFIAVGLLVEADSRIVARRDASSADPRRHVEKLIEFDEVIAQSARDRRAPSEVFSDKWLNDFLLEPLLEVHDVIRDAEVLRDCARVVNIVERATPAGRFAALQFREAALIPELHR
jgi:hypothetical protein